MHNLFFHLERRQLFLHFSKDGISVATSKKTFSRSDEIINYDEFENNNIKNEVKHDFNNHLDLIMEEFDLQQNGMEDSISGDNICGI
jgi:hypothetical protein